MRHILHCARSVMWNIISWPFIFIGALVYVFAYFLVTSKEDRLFERRMEDIMIAGHGNPGAGAWLAEVYTNRMREEISKNSNS